MAGVDTEVEALVEALVEASVVLRCEYIRGERTASLIHDILPTVDGCVWWGGCGVVGWVGG